MIYKKLEKSIIFLIFYNRKHNQELEIQTCKNYLLIKLNLIKKIQRISTLRNSSAISVRSKNECYLYNLKLF